MADAEKRDLRKEAAPVHKSRENSTFKHSPDSGSTSGSIRTLSECSYGESKEAAVIRTTKRRRCARDVNEYSLIGPVGEGAYGVVWKARDPESGRPVALKMIKTGADSGIQQDEMGFPITSIREIRILKLLRHDNIVNLLDVATDVHGSMKGGKPGDVYMVFDYLDADLEGIMKTPELRLTSIHVKSFMHQLLLGLEYMHRHKVIHRDLKGANLLVSTGGRLKIGDFGLARSLHSNVKVLTSKVITLWYRPPELLMRASMYSTAIDMWSVGCIFAELLQGSALFPGKDEAEQLNRIFDMCGTPTSETWPNVNACPDWEAHWKTEAAKNPRQSNLRKKFHNLSPPSVLDLLERLLRLDPRERISAKEALSHDYFYDSPKVVSPECVPRLNFQSCHELEAKKRAKEERIAQMKKKEEDERKAKEIQMRAIAHRSAQRKMASRGGYPSHLARPAISKESTGW
mmetsp:Transcript_14066/g.20790  ORF Transcript_14066/g.20790 Transcript_14066/m.20790 type:complete len:459 (-) Transcript_14066:265-1641(-)|eukprot:CAMPEP_0171461502 /NCGR_PEP_ID=MMETSP0945-20130129/5924_1 /TAXON_ID=109269 /ORGANISM="Vaucheria litorea, Strain CCMP2940" /LENGTH=458 /DNA_ID=CAMNT_0011987861 /DNA_START=291 /DNA_END=1664 /DNA_ORIENTATION=+